MSANPRISVLLPLQDERESGMSCVRAWTHQAADPESFEILGLAPGEDRTLESSVRPLLRANDCWIVARGADEYELLNVGASEALGRYLFITEAHCIPEPECLAAMLEELDRTGAPGVRGQSVPEAHGRLGALEMEAFQESLLVEEDPDHWRKVLIHSLAIRRDLYVKEGGLPPRYGDFAPWPLAIALRSSGQRLAFSRQPRVRHIYDGDLEQLGAHVRSFGRGEMRYRSEAPDELAEAYLEPAPEWEQRLEQTRAGALLALRAALAIRQSGVWRESLRHAVVALLGPRAAIASARARAARAARRAKRSDDPRRRRREFREFWRLTSRRGRLEGLAEARLGETTSIPEAERMNLTESLAGRAIGFFTVESVDGMPIRWTAPLAMIKVHVPGPSRARARLKLHPFERPASADPPQPRVAVDNEVVPATVSKEAIGFEVDPGEHWISIASVPLRPRRHGVDDWRALGMPVRSLSFE